MLTEEQVEQIKGQLLKQIESFPEDKRDELKSQIEAMNAEELEEFLTKNNLLKTHEEGKEPSPSNCVFCSIKDGAIPSYKIAENKKALAILELNPLSPGHILVLSRDHKTLPSQALTLASKISKKIKEKLKPEEVKIESGNLLGHQVVQVIPIYKDVKLEKKKASEKDLILLQEKLTVKKNEKKSSEKTGTRKITELKPNLEKAPRRIP
jgi:diadenosine tetraphosphate (Ap4A) HIT family hydrolase